ncbi:MAG: DUF1653 domain-containing protein [Pseudomonadota bacterium]
MLSRLIGYFRRSENNTPDFATVFVQAWQPTHRHRKGQYYRVVAEGVNENDRVPVVIYDDKEGAVWVRPRSEFYDGRFLPSGDIKK